MSNLVIHVISMTPALPVCADFGGWRKPDQQNFERIRFRCRRCLNDMEVARVCGALAYALRATLAGDDLSLPVLMLDFRQHHTNLYFQWDSESSIRSEPDFVAALETAVRFIEEGTPIRLTNRAGCGTFGTRLFDGIGRCDVEIHVR